MTPEQAIRQLSALAADFKVGIVSEQFVEDMMRAIVCGMTNDQDSYDQLMREVLEPWGQEYTPRYEQEPNLGDLLRARLTGD